MAAIAQFDSAFAGDLQYVDVVDALRPHVWMLGREYVWTQRDKTNRDRLLTDIQQLLWFSYRKGFPKIGASGYHSDSGWGCMLRCGQMLIGNTLERHWSRVYPADQARKLVLPWFSDIPECIFSIHSIALGGMAMDKAVGDWFGPNTMAQVLRNITSTHPECGVTVHVVMDSQLVVDEAVALASGEDGSWRALLLLIPLRLGLHRFDMAFLPQLCEFFGVPQSVGAIGGRPNAAMYFIGCQEGSVICLDPHTTQRSLGVLRDQSWQSYSSPSGHWMAAADIDPSLCMGFYCPSREDLDAVVAHLRRPTAAQHLVAVVDHAVPADHLLESLTNASDFEEEGDHEVTEVDGFELV